MTSHLLRATLAGTALSLFLVACGGGGGGGSSSGSSSTPASASFSPSSSLAAQCTATQEKAWLRSMTNEHYLWYNEVPDPDPSTFATPLAYFDVLKTSALTASGRPKDRFHFTYTTSEWSALTQSGVSTGYGMEVRWMSSKPYVAYVSPDSPAERAGLRRGTEILAVDGLEVANSQNSDAINNALYPSAAGQFHDFTVRQSGASAGSTSIVKMTSAAVTLSPVMNTSAIDTLGNGKVGYIQFNDHVDTAESALATAINQLKNDGVNDLVLDIRYNGGGALYIASELAYMIAGPTRTDGKAFQQLVRNNKEPVDTPTPFYDMTDTQKLPTLGLNRVFVLTTGSTCSASEAIINGLRGVGVEVIQIGDTTCGKPFGFNPQDNCGTTYFSINFQGKNAVGFGAFEDGFVPAGSGKAGLPGCKVADDLSHPLGNPDEALLSAALRYRATGTCPTQSFARAVHATKSTDDADLNHRASLREPWRNNAFLTR